MVVRRGRVLLRGKQAVEVGLLCGRLTEDDRDGLQGDGGVHGAEIVFGLRHGLNVTRHAKALCVLNRTFYEARLSGQGSGQYTCDEKGLWDAMHVKLEIQPRRRWGKSGAM